MIHGIVTRIDNIQFFREKLTDPDRLPQFAVVPPYHSVSRHGTDGFPLYALSSRELIMFETRLAPLLVGLEDFRKRLAQP